MANNDVNLGTDGSQAEPLTYRIRVKGHLGPEWINWFGGLTVTLEDTGDTLLSGPVIDQAALHGVLRTIRDLGLPLVSVSPVKKEQNTCIQHC